LVPLPTTAETQQGAKRPLAPARPFPKLLQRPTISLVPIDSRAFPRNVPSDARRTAPIASCPCPSHPKRAWPSWFVETNSIFFGDRSNKPFKPGKSPVLPPFFGPRRVQSPTQSDVPPQELFQVPGVRSRPRTAAWGCSVLVPCSVVMPFSGMTAGSGAQEISSPDWIWRRRVRYLRASSHVTSQYLRANLGREVGLVESGLWVALAEIPLSDAALVRGLRRYHPHLQQERIPELEERVHQLERRDRPPQGPQEPGPPRIAPSVLRSPPRPPRDPPMPKGGGGVGRGSAKPLPRTAELTQSRLRNSFRLCDRPTGLSSKVYRTSVRFRSGPSPVSSA